MLQVFSFMYFLILLSISPKRYKISSAANLGQRSLRGGLFRISKPPKIIEFKYSEKHLLNTLRLESESRLYSQYNFLKYQEKGSRKRKMRVGKYSQLSALRGGIRLAIITQQLKLQKTQNSFCDTKFKQMNNSRYGKNFLTY